MWLPPKVLARLFVATAAVLTVIAISLGRSDTKPSEIRRRVNPRHQPVNMHLFQPHHDDLLMLDVEAGKTEHLDLADASLLKYASCSPWQDRWGRTHLVGLWTGRVRQDKDLAIGLTRYALPGKEVLDRIEMDVLPASSPCWYPDTTARVLFAGADGHLYRFSFEDPQGLDPTADDPKRPHPLTWQTQPPAGLISISAPTWPAHPSLGGKLIAALSTIIGGERPQPGVPPASQTQLWWLQLNRTGSAIAAAGPLISNRPEDSTERMAIEDLPSIATLPDGRLLLASLVQGKEAGSHYRLRLTPLTLQGPLKLPSVNEAVAVEFSEQFLFSPPAFSNDGRWVYAVTRPAQDPVRVERFSVIDALAGKPAQIVESAPPPTSIRLTEGPLPAKPTTVCMAFDRLGDEPSP